MSDQTHHLTPAELREITPPRARLLLRIAAGHKVDPAESARLHSLTELGFLDGRRLTAIGSAVVREVEHAETARAAWRKSAGPGMTIQLRIEAVVRAVGRMTGVELKRWVGVGKGCTRFRRAAEAGRLIVYLHRGLLYAEVPKRLDDAQVLDILGQVEQQKNAIEAEIARLEKATASTVAKLRKFLTSREQAKVGALLVRLAAEAQP